MIELLIGTTELARVRTPTPSSTVTFGDMSLVTDGTRAVALTPVNAAPVAALDILKEVDVATVITAFEILKAVVESPTIVTIWPAKKVLAAVYVITPAVAETAVTVAVRVGVVVLIERV
jgi:hypothetical protein